MCYDALLRRQLLNRGIKLLSIAVVGGWLLVLAEIKLGFLASAPSEGFVDISQVGNLLATGLLMPMTILLLALMETVKHGLGKKLSFLGDISYSSYLLHFPLQLVVAASAGVLGVGSAFFYSRVSLIGFFLLLIGISLLSYHYFERPMQQRIRRWGGARGSLGTTKARSPQADASPFGN
jgi:peptidoglycan/LPS O-acetylase OafA/YrhL